VSSQEHAAKRIRVVARGWSLSNCAHPGSEYIVEGYRIRHVECDVGGECRKLLMNISEECVGAPPTHELDGVGRLAIEVHCHCPASAQGVGADALGVKTFILKVECDYSKFQSTVDVIGIDLPAPRVGWTEVGADHGLTIIGVGHNVFDSADKGLNRAVKSSGCMMVDDLVPLAIFLVGYI